jgi:hypothetical protein
MFHSLNKIIQKDLRIRFQIIKTYSSQSIEEKREIKRRYYNIFLNEINKKDFNGDKHENLVYLSNLFNSFQNFISMDNIRNSSVISHWQSFFYGVNYTKINETVSYLHNHENYKKLKSSILLNFNNYDSKEIAFICKTYNALNLRNENDEINLKIVQFCENNIQKFDLHDIYNTTFSKRLITRQFWQNSFDYVLENIKKESIKYVALDIDKNEDIFENTMQKLDSDKKLWFKLNILRCYTSMDCDRSKIESLSDYLLNEALFLTKSDQNVYEINTIINLMNRVRFYAILVKKENLELLRTYMKEDYLEKMFKGLDLCYYKKEFFGYLDTTCKLMNQNQLDFLVNYFSDNTKKAKNDYLLFLYSKALDQVLTAKSLNRKHRSKLNIRNGYDKRNYLIEHINPYYYNLVDNLDEDFKKTFENQYDSLISCLDGFNFEFVASSLRLIYNIHSNKQEVLNSFYKSFFGFYSNIKPVDLKHFQKSILFTLETLIELKDESNELNKSNEIKFCSLLENKLDSYYSKYYTLRSKKNLIAFFMLNEETLLKNFDFIKDQLINDILINYPSFKLNEIICLLNKHLNVLLREHKQDSIQILSLLLINHANSLLDINKNIIISLSKSMLLEKIIKMMKTIYYEKDTKLIDIEDKKSILSGLSKLNINLYENLDNNIAFNDNNKFMRIDNKLVILVKMLKYGNNYSDQILDRIYNFLIQTFSIFLESPQNSKDIRYKLKNLVRIMSIYSHFDYTSNENYFKNFELFENLNNQIYKNLLRSNMTWETLSMYVEALISLNLYVESAFKDLITYSEGVKHF